MNHFIDFDPYTIGQHHRQIRTETDSLRLQEQLRKNRGVHRSSRLFAVAKQMARSGDPISPGRTLQTSQHSFVQTRLAGGDRRHGHRGE
jgi:hypothetical protein